MAIRRPGSMEPEKSLGPRVLEWFRKRQRTLPWRGSADPYRVWVSEIMLQQTRVDTVIPYYGRFLERFPSIESLAEAPVEEVLARWSGLGYYGRARRLHQAARAIVEKHGGEFPRDHDEALALPGVGAYTAAAVLSIAHGTPIPVLDGNVERVLSRCFRIGGDPKSRAAADRMRSIAREAMPEGAAGDFNQGLMELGALVCTPREPDCAACPVEDLCAGRRRGDALRYPEKPRARPSIRVELEAAIVRRGSRYLLERMRKGPLEGLWVLPLAESPEALREGRAPASIKERLERELETELRSAGPEVSVMHSITYRRIRIRALLLEPVSRIAKDVPGKDGIEYRWVSAGDIGRSVPVSSIVTKVLERLGGKEGERNSPRRHGGTERRKAGEKNGSGSGRGRGSGKRGNGSSPRRHGGTEGRS